MGAPSDGPESRSRTAALRVVHTLRDAGHTAYFAGGCVRDELLGTDPDDYDIATDATPDRVVTLFERTHTVGAAFAVVLVKMGREKVEVATFRSDGEYRDARRPESVTFSTPEGDAARRDFTINALFLDPFAEESDRTRWDGGEARGQVIDFVGGLKDLRAGVVRAVGDPDARLKEDHLRALRAVRFASRFGFDLDPTTADAIRAHAKDLRGVSKERVGEELRKIAAHPTAARGAGLVEALGLGESILGSPSATGSAGIESSLSELPVEMPPPVVFAAWAIARAGGRAVGIGPAVVSESGAAGVAGVWRRALMLSNDESVAMRSILELVGRFANEWASAGVAQQKRWAAQTWARAAVAVLRAFDRDRADSVEAGIRGLEADGIGIAPAPLIDGDRLVAEGFQPGPAFGKVLSVLYDEQLEGRWTGTEEGLHRARELFPDPRVGPR